MLLSEVVEKYVEPKKLTPAERAESIRMAEGTTVKASASVANLSAETIRARRKRIYNKLGVDGHVDFMAQVMMFVLQEASKMEASSIDTGV